MVDPKALKWAAEFTDPVSGYGRKTVVFLVSKSLIAAAAELSRQAIELAALRLAVEEARKAIEDAPHAMGCKLVVWHGREMAKCTCWKSRTLVLLPAPDQPLPLEALIRDIVADYSERGSVYAPKLDALCALVQQEGK